MMGRTVDEVIDALPAERRARIDQRFLELKDEVEGLAEFRRAAGKTQRDIAAALNIKQPSVSKIEKQADMYLSTLRSYIEAIGGRLELIVQLPSRPPLRIESLGDVVAAKGRRVRASKASEKRPARTQAKRKPARRTPAASAPLP